VAFTTIYPGWYAGRATHIHVDVYRSGAIVKTLQVGISLQRLCNGVTQLSSMPTRRRLLWMMPSPDGAA
jgi:protocatechuate 3,4-dioxygenase beta subunit